MSVRHQLSDNFYLDEFTRSDVAARHGIEIHVEPGSEIYDNLSRLCVELLQPLRDTFGPIHVLSGYRPPRVNKLVGGADKSAHLYGRAADVYSPDVPPLVLAKFVARNMFRYDQVIHEFGRWAHLAVSPIGVLPRYETLTSFKSAGKVRKRTVYVAGLYPIDEAMGKAA